MFTQNFYEAIKGFQFHFTRGIVYGEESSKSLSPHQITKISKNVRSRDQFKKVRDRDRRQKAETKTLKIGFKTFITARRPGRKKKKCYQA